MEHFSWINLIVSVSLTNSDRVMSCPFDVNFVLLPIDEVRYGSVIAPSELDKVVAPIQ